MSMNAKYKVEDTLDITFPFLWKYKGGGIYIRYSHGMDLRVHHGNNSDTEEFGPTITPGALNVTDVVAWNWRLTKSETITLRNNA